MRLPDFVIIGAMKCATSTLHDQLALQPGFFMSEPKEPNFFSDDAEYARGLDWYAGLFQNAAANDLCGESSTHYTKLHTHPKTLERMRAVLPRVKLIYVMRHPIERLISQYVHEWSENRVRGTIDEAVEQYPPLVDYSRYSMQIAPYIEVYGRENILPVFFERMTRHPQDTLERVGRFLGYTGNVCWQQDLGARNQGAERLRKSRLRDALVHAPLLSTIRKKLVPTAWRDWVKGFWQMRDKPRLAPETEARLRAVFDEDLEQLGRSLGVSLRCDNFREATTATALEWDRKFD